MRAQKRSCVFSPCDHLPARRLACVRGRRCVSTDMHARQVQSLHRPRTRSFAGVSTIVALLLSRRTTGVLRHRAGDGAQAAVRCSRAGRGDLGHADRHHRDRDSQHRQRVRDQSRRQGSDRPRVAAGRDRLGRMRDRHRTFEGGARHGVQRRARLLGHRARHAARHGGLLLPAAGPRTHRVVAHDQINLQKVAATPFIVAPISLGQRSPARW